MYLRKAWVHLFSLLQLCTVSWAGEAHLFSYDDCSREDKLWIQTKYIALKWGGSTHDVVANVLDLDIIVSEFEYQSLYYVHFLRSTLRKDIEFTAPSPQLGVK